MPTTILNFESYSIVVYNRVYLIKCNGVSIPDRDSSAKFWLTIDNYCGYFIKVSL